MFLQTANQPRLLLTQTEVWLSQRKADPLETHVYLQTSENDETAREMLDISEQTCFLHAFCRTDLKTKLKIRRL